MSTGAPLQNTAAKSLRVSKSPHAGLLLQRKCACGGSSGVSGMCEECQGKRLQRKLTIGASNDPLEAEADRVADQILAAPAHSAVSGSPPRIQRFTGQSTGDAGTAPASVDRVLSDSGRPLEPALRQDMEQRFGHDFSNVRVHSGGAAEQSARDVNANAYTVGHNVVFGAGRFAPGTQEGRRLLAHELTHVVQQSGSDGFHVSQSSEKRDLSPFSLANRHWLARQASPLVAQAEPEFDKFDFIGKVRYYLNAQNEAIALSYVFRVLNGLSMKDMLKTITALSDLQLDKLTNNLTYASGLNVPRIEITIFAVNGRRRRRNFDCCLLSSFSEASPDDGNAIRNYLSAAPASHLATAPAHQISDTGIQLIADAEGFIDHLYNDPVGHCTIGYGHLVHRGNCNTADQATWGRSITNEAALILLRGDAQSRVDDVNRLVRVQITQSQFDALASFQFNTGALAGSSVLHELNKCNHRNVPNKLKQFTKARNQAGHMVELAGLTTRRNRESAMFSEAPLCQ